MTAANRVAVRRSNPHRCVISPMRKYASAGHDASGLATHSTVSTQVTSTRLPSPPRRTLSPSEMVTGATGLRKLTASSAGSQVVRSLGQTRRTDPPSVSRYTHCLVIRTVPSRGSSLMIGGGGATASGPHDDSGVPDGEPDCVRAVTPGVVASELGGAGVGTCDEADGGDVPFGDTGVHPNKRIEAASPLASARPVGGSARSRRSCMTTSCGRSEGGSVLFHVTAVKESRRVEPDDP